MSLQNFDIVIDHDELLPLVHEKMAIFIMFGFLIQEILTEILLNLFTMFSIKILQFYFWSYCPLFMKLCHFFAMSGLSIDWFQVEHYET